MLKILLSSLLLCALSVQTAGAQDIKMPNQPKKAKYNDFSTREKGFWCAVEAGVGTTVENNMRNMQRADLSFTGGYRFSEYLRAGVGVGAGYYFNNTSRRSTNTDVNIPIFANVRGNMVSQYSRTAVPYWSMSIGGKVDDGFFVKPTVGCRFGELRQSFLLGLSYEYSRMKFADPDKKGASYFSLVLGYEF